MVWQLTMAKLFRSESSGKKKNMRQEDPATWRAIRAFCHSVFSGAARHPTKPPTYLRISGGFFICETRMQLYARIFIGCQFRVRRFCVRTAHHPPAEGGLQRWRSQLTRRRQPFKPGAQRLTGCTQVQLKTARRAVFLEVLDVFLDEQTTSGPLSQR